MTTNFKELMSWVKENGPVRIIEMNQYTFDKLHDAYPEIDTLDIRFQINNDLDDFKGVAFNEKAIIPNSAELSQQILRFKQKLEPFQYLDDYIK